MSEAILKEKYEKVLKENTLQASTILKLTEEKKEQANRIELLEVYLDWFRRVLFSHKSEKRHEKTVVEGLPLFSASESDTEEETSSEKETVVPAHTRKKRRGKKKDLGDNGDSGLRFDSNVEIQEEEIYPDEISGLGEDEYEIIGFEVSDHLATRESKNYIQRRKYYKVKLKEKNNIVKSPVIPPIFPRSYLAVSFLVDMIIEKCLYSIPLYRQHQRLTREGIYLSRSTLIGNFIRVSQLLEPVFDAQRVSVLLSKILAIDESPMKVGVDKILHKMKQGYVWAMYGDKDELIYEYNQSRAAYVLKELLDSIFRGILITDGYSAYKCYIAGLEEADLGASVEHASCWVHARRKFVELEKSRPREYRVAIDLIGKLYKIESELREKNSSSAEVYSRRQQESSKVVDEYFNWLRSYDGKTVIATSDVLRLALSYSLEREASMRVFLRDPKLQLDTNHLEREIRPIAIGRKNWLFCWTEVGAKSLCVYQSLIRTCLLHGVNPRHYLVDVLEQISSSKGTIQDFSDFTPRLWKENNTQQWTQPLAKAA